MVIDSHVVLCVDFSLVLQHLTLLVFFFFDLPSEPIVSLQVVFLLQVLHVLGCSVHSCLALWVLKLDAHGVEVFCLQTLSVGQILLLVQSLVRLRLLQVLTLCIVASAQMVEFCADVASYFILFGDHAVFPFLDESFVFLMILHSLSFVQVLVLHVAALGILDLSLKSCPVESELLLFFMTLDVGFLVNNLLRFRAINSFLNNLVFKSLSVLLFSGFQGHLQQLSFLSFSLYLQRFLQFFFIDELFKVFSHLALVPAQLHVRFFLLAVEDFPLVLDDCAPLVELAVLGDWVVSLFVGWEGLNLVQFLVQRLFDTVGHFERVHNCFCSALHFNRNN
jgi:hypothetical protein